VQVFAGLTAAIECHSKGHHVILFEKSAFLNPLGEIISFASNSGRIFQRWAGVGAQLDPINHKSKCIIFCDWHGSDIMTQNWDREVPYGKKFIGHRGEFHHIVFNHAKAREIDIRLGQNVIDYFETDTHTGIAISNVDGSTTKLTADCVLTAEGPDLLAVESSWATSLAEILRPRNLPRLVPIGCDCCQSKDLPSSGKWRHPLWLDRT
jgi:2-polyprenyl-6-methoxyphenol hydroxylase-like FAD-dependent oxidoreductase